MRAALVAGCAMALAVLPMSVSAQEVEDDWEFAEDAARGLTVAMVRYEGGQAIVAQCEGGVLKGALIGLPATTETHYAVQARRGDGRTDNQLWAAAPGQTAFMTDSAARSLRFMRGGGLFEIIAEPGSAAIRATFDLPSQSANLDRVLTACGWPLEDERDVIPEVRGILIQISRSEALGARTSPARPTIEINCLTRSRELRECRPGRLRPGFEVADRRAAEAMNGTSIAPERSGGTITNGVVTTFALVPD